MSSEEQIRMEIMAQVQASVTVRQELDKYAIEVRDYWRSISPIGKKPDDKNPGAYAASVQVFKRKFTYKGMPGVGVGATDFKAHWIEYGTGNPGPTPAFAPRAKTAAHFGGNEQLLQDILDDNELSQSELKEALSQFKIGLVPEGLQ
jgi:hypothetical protein